MRSLKTFKCTHILGASRGLLCDTYAVLFNIFYVIMSTTDEAMVIIVHNHIRRTSAAVTTSATVAVQCTLLSAEVHGTGRVLLSLALQ